MRNNSTGNTGFTLIELLVVIAIMGLIATISTFAINQVKVKSRDTSRVSHIKMIQDGLAMYQNENNIYPNLSRLTITGSDELSSILINAGIMQGMPVDPTNSPPYIYEYEANDNGNDYTLYYYLETDTIPGKSQGANTAKP